MFKAIANMAGVLVVLCFIIFLAGVVVNKNRVTKDEAAAKAKDAIARASESGAEFFRDTIAPTAPAPEAEPEPMPVATDPVARALVSEPRAAASANAPDMDLIRRLLKQAESSQSGRRRTADEQPAKPISAAKPAASELVKPAHVRPAPPRGAPAIRRAAHTPSGPTTYVVKRGDTLYRIAVAHYGDGKMWKAIAKANGISNPSKISVGVKLVLPPRRVTSASVR